MQVALVVTENSLNVISSQVKEHFDIEIVNTDKHLFLRDQPVEIFD
jgi:hypothetical protein